MRRSLPVPSGVLIAAALACALAAPARAMPSFELGIGEQQPAFFSDPRFLALGLEHVRVVTAYDVACRPQPETGYLDTWLAGAERAGVRPLVAFSFSPRPGQRWRLPGYRTYLRCFRAFRARYPQVRDFNPWNEANHSSQPTYRHPKKAAGFYNAMRRACPRCNVAAGDVLDWSHLVRWLERYKVHLRGRPRLWSMHNYIDVNRPRRWRESGTRKVLQMTRGRLWITETAGVVVSRRYTKYDERRAAAATARIFDIARRSKRIERLYGYQWQAGCDRYSWDSGWFRSNGSPRPAWYVVIDEVSAARDLAPAEIEALDPPLSAAMHDTCAGVE
jgi:hypothetical protein